MPRRRGRLVDGATMDSYLQQRLNNVTCAVVGRADHDESEQNVSQKHDDSHGEEHVCNYSTTAGMHQYVRAAHTARQTHALLDDSVNTLAASLLS